MKPSTKGFGSISETPRFCFGLLRTQSAAPTSGTHVALRLFGLKMQGFGLMQWIWGGRSKCWSVDTLAPEAGGCWEPSGSLWGPKGNPGFHAKGGGLFALRELLSC